MGPVRQNPIQRTVSLFICVCIALCTIVAHIIAQNRPDSFPPYPPDDHHSSNDVYLREGGATIDTSCAYLFAHNFYDICRLHDVDQDHNLCSFHLLTREVNSTWVDQLHDERTTGAQHADVDVFATGRRETPLARQNELVERLTDVLLDRRLRFPFAVDEPRRLTQLTTVLVIATHAQSHIPLRRSKTRQNQGWVSCHGKQYFCWDSGKNWQKPVKTGKNWQ